MNDMKLDRILGKITSGLYKRIVVMTGAGISCASGIPDFRSPGGLYATLRSELLTASDSQRDYLAHDPTGVCSLTINDKLFYRSNDYFSGCRHSNV